MRRADYTAFAAALIDPGRAPPAGLLVAPDAQLTERFAVHRNNVHVSLVEALAERYPVVKALVGEEFFHSMARDFVAGCKPDSPLLGEYGAALPAFIECFEPARALPCLADVARLEDAWQQSWSAADAAAMTLPALAGLSPDVLLACRFRAHPATRLLQSPWPIADLWQAHRQPDPDLADLAWHGQNVLVTRPDADVRLLELPRGVAALAASLLAGADLGTAAHLAMTTAPELDTGTALQALIGAGAFTELPSP
jgi:hypothetical protein